MRPIHNTQPDMKILAVSSYSDRDYILGMLQKGGLDICPERGEDAK